MYQRKNHYTAMVKKNAHIEWDVVIPLTLATTVVIVMMAAMLIVPLVTYIMNDRATLPAIVADVNNLETVYGEIREFNQEYEYKIQGERYNITFKDGRQLSLMVPRDAITAVYPFREQVFYKIQYDKTNHCIYEIQKLEKPEHIKIKI